MTIKVTYHLTRDQPNKKMFSHLFVHQHPLLLIDPGKSFKKIESHRFSLFIYLCNKGLETASFPQKRSHRKRDNGRHQCKRWHYTGIE